MPSHSEMSEVRAQLAAALTERDEARADAARFSNECKRIADQRDKLKDELYEARAQRDAQCCEANTLRAELAKHSVVSAETPLSIDPQPDCGGLGYMDSDDSAEAKHE